MPNLAMLKAAGLYTADNPHSSVPEGALLSATNAVLRYRNRVQSRRGLGYRRREGDNGEADVMLADDTQRSREGTWYQGVQVLHAGTSTLCRDAGGLDGDGNPVFTDYSGSYEAVDEDMLRMKFVEAAQNLYFNTNAGIYLLDSVSSTPTLAGVPAALDDYYSDSNILSRNTGDDGWMPEDSSAAYRYTWAITDAQGNLKEGAPSGRFIVRNRLDAPVGAVVRAANVVTVTVSIAHNFQVGDLVELLNPDGDFSAGPHTLTGATQFTFTYSETAANDTSTVVYSFSAPRNVLLRPRIPPGITTSHFLRIWRSEETTDADLEPLDELFLVKETFPTATDISNGYLDATDLTPSSQLDVPAYFNANTGDGPLQDTAKYGPPIGKDMLLWDGRLWLLNTKDKHRFHLRLLGVGSPDGIQNNDTLTIGGQAFTGKTSGASFASYEFAISTSSASAFQNIELTARSLAACINHNSLTLGLTAYYESGVDDAPGKLLIEERGIGGDAFSVYASRLGSWGPALSDPFARGTLTLTGVAAGDRVEISGYEFEGVTGAVTPGDAEFSVDTDDDAAAASLAAQITAFAFFAAPVVNATSAGNVVSMVALLPGAGGNAIGTVSLDASIVASASTLLGGDEAEGSTNDSRPHAGSYSELDEPEAFPLNNWVPIAPKGVELLRGIGFKNSLFCFGDNGKVYTVTGPAPYRVEETDGSVRLLAPDSVVLHANQVFALTDQGVGILTEAGFRIVSQGIEEELLNVLDLDTDVVRRTIFGVSYEQERQYQLWVPRSNNETHGGAYIGYVYNSLHGTWTSWTGYRTWGRVSPLDGKLYMGEASLAKVREERKNFDRTDFADEELAAEVTTASGSTLGFTFGAIAPEVGDVIVLESGEGLLVEDVGNNVVTVDRAHGWTAPFPIRIFKAYAVFARWAPLAPGDPRVEKTWQDCTFHFHKYLACGLVAFFTTEVNLTDFNLPLKETVDYGVGPLPHTTAELGPRNRRVEVSANHRTAAMITVAIGGQEAFADWQLNGFTLSYEIAGNGSRS